MLKILKENFSIAGLMLETVYSAFIVLLQRMQTHTHIQNVNFAQISKFWKKYLSIMINSFVYLLIQMFLAITKHLKNQVESLHFFFFFFFKFQMIILMHQKFHVFYSLFKKEILLFCRRIKNK